MCEKELEELIEKNAAMQSVDTESGERYEIKIDGKEIDVDWIIRRDKYQIIY